jgi:hypothetical protein
MVLPHIPVFNKFIYYSKLKIFHKIGGFPSSFLPLLGKIRWFSATIYSGQEIFFVACEFLPKIQQSGNSDVHILIAMKQFNYYYVTIVGSCWLSRQNQNRCKDTAGPHGINNLSSGAGPWSHYHPWWRGVMTEIIGFSLPQNRFLKGWALGQARRAQLPIPS